MNIVEEELNSDFPLRGFSPVANTTLNSLEWYTGGVKKLLSVNTISYHSLTNQSVYTFFFDPITGLLLQASLDLYDSNWVTGYDTKSLHIQRTFLMNVFENVNLYLNLDRILTFVFISTVLTIFGMSSYYYRRTSTKNKLEIIP